MQPNSSHCGRFETFDSRRQFLARSAGGFGSLVLEYLLARETARGDSQTQRAANGGRPTAGRGPKLLAPRPRHFEAKAKSVIMLFMTGGPSQLETFDPKPELKRFDGKSLPPSFNPTGISLQFMKPTEGKLLASPFAFRKHGRSGLEISDIFPHLAKHADRLAVIRSCYHESFIHGPAHVHDDRFAPAGAPERRSVGDLWIGLRE